MFEGVKNVKEIGMRRSNGLYIPAYELQDIPVDEWNAMARKSGGYTMNGLESVEITIEASGRSVAVKECQGQRVISLKDIDTVHKRPDGTARRSFNSNKKHFIMSEDYFVRNSYEAKNEYGIAAPNGLILLTQIGYLMLVKSFNDDLAWRVQRQLVNSYFMIQQGPALPAQSTRPALSPPQPEAALTGRLDRLISLLEQQYQQAAAVPLLPELELDPEQEFIERLRNRKRLTRKEAYKYMGVSHGTLDRLQKDPDFPALVRICGRVFFDREKIDEWLDNGGTKYKRGAI